jgi:transposase
VLSQKLLQTTPREAELLSRLEAMASALEVAQRENALLRQKLDLVLRRMFGSSSEKVSKDQLELLLALAETPAPAPVEKEKLMEPAPRPRKERRQRLPENLPVVEEVLEPEAVKAEPGQWRRIGEEVSEQLDYEPGRFFRRRLIRPKYVHRSDRDLAPIVAALPERLLERSLPAPGLLAHVLVSKYCDHLPLYRQESIYSSRHGVMLPRQTVQRQLFFPTGDDQNSPLGVRGVGALGGGAEEGEP